MGGGGGMGGGRTRGCWGGGCERGAWRGFTAGIRGETRQITSRDLGEGASPTGWADMWLWTGDEDFTRVPWGGVVRSVREHRCDGFYSPLTYGCSGGGARHRLRRVGLRGWIATEGRTSRMVEGVERHTAAWHSARRPNRDAGERRRDDDCSPSAAATSTDGTQMPPGAARRMGPTHREASQHQTGTRRADLHRNLQARADEGMTLR